MRFTKRQGQSNLTVSALGPARFFVVPENLEIQKSNADPDNTWIACVQLPSLESLRTFQSTRTNLVFHADT